MSLKSFEVAAKAKQADEGTPFDIEGHKMLAYQPDEAQFAMLMAFVGRGSSDADRVAGLINFLIAILDPKGADYLQRRLLDRDDDYGIEDVENLMEWLTEEWSGNPTRGQSASTPSPSTTGSSSTGRSLI
jgi:hypothetical protein